MTHKPLLRRVDILTKDLGILSAGQTGLPFAVQAVRVVVTTGTEARSHVVVRGAAAPWGASFDIDRVRALFPADFVSCVRADSPGAADLACAAGSEMEILGAAAAVAALARAWGWDESPAIVVRIEGTPITVSADPQFENGHWIVAVT